MRRIALSTTEELRLPLRWIDSQPYRSAPTTGPQLCSQFVDVSDVMVEEPTFLATVSIKNLIDTERKVIDMNLTLTQYIDAKPHEVSDRLDRAIVHGLDAAASRIRTPLDDVEIEEIGDVVRIHSGLRVLDGCEVHVTGGNRLTVLEVVVPWTPVDNDGAKLLAANAFAHTVAIEVDAAA